MHQQQNSQSGVKSKNHPNNSSVVVNHTHSVQGHSNKTKKETNNNSNQHNTNTNNQKTVVSNNHSKKKEEPSPKPAVTPAPTPVAPASKLTSPTAIQINNAINRLSSRQPLPNNFNLDSLKLPPGITITKVDPSQVTQQRKPITQQVRIGSNLFLENKYLLFINVNLCLKVVY